MNNRKNSYVSVFIFSVLCMMSVDDAFAGEIDTFVVDLWCYKKEELVSDRILTELRFILRRKHLGGKYCQFEVWENNKMYHLSESCNFEVEWSKVSYSGEFHGVIDRKNVNSDVFHISPMSPHVMLRSEKNHAFSEYELSTYKDGKLIRKWFCGNAQTYHPDGYNRHILDPTY